MSQISYLDDERATLATIRSRGNWELLFRPNTFKSRVPKARELFEIVEKSAINLAGWRFPFVPDQAGEVLNDTRRHEDSDWVGQLHRWEHHLEAWRFYASGQFVLATSVPWDWRDVSTVWPVRENEKWEKNTVIGIRHIAQMSLQMFLFCARLIESPAGSELVHVEVSLAPTEGRFLFSDSALRLIRPAYKADVDRIVLKYELANVDLLAKLDDLVAELVGNVFAEFGFKAAPSVLNEIISEAKKY